MRNRRPLVLIVIALVTIGLGAVAVYLGQSFLQPSTSSSETRTTVPSPIVSLPTKVAIASPTVPSTPLQSERVTDIPNNTTSLPQPTSLIVASDIPLVVNTPSPTSANAHFFAQPDQPAYIPAQGFTPDAQRILDITTLQVGLEKYHTANGRYPLSLDALFPNYAPIADGQKLAEPPQDPQTKQPYVYLVLSDGANYQITAILSNGEKYTATQPTIH